MVGWLYTIYCDVRLRNTTVPKEKQKVEITKIQIIGNQSGNDNVSNNNNNNNNNNNFISPRPEYTGLMSSGR